MRRYYKEWLCYLGKVLKQSRKHVPTDGQLGANGGLLPIEGGMLITKSANFDHWVKIFLHPDCAGFSSCWRKAPQRQAFWRLVCWKFYLVLTGPRSFVLPPFPKINNPHAA
jgi:hypothetical protein